MYKQSDVERSENAEKRGGERKTNAFVSQDKEEKDATINAVSKRENSLQIKAPNKMSGSFEVDVAVEYFKYVTCYPGACNNINCSLNGTSLSVFIHVTLIMEAKFLRFFLMVLPL